MINRIYDCTNKDNEEVQIDLDGIFLIQEDRQRQAYKIVSTGAAIVSVDTETGKEIKQVHAYYKNME